MLNDDEVVRKMVRTVCVYEEPVKMSRCVIQWATDMIYLPEIRLVDSNKWVRMTPAARRQILRLVGWESDDNSPEAWESLDRAISDMKEVRFRPRLVRGKGGVWWLQALCKPGYWPPSEVGLFYMLSDALMMYANPEYCHESHVVCRVEVTGKATIVAVTRDRTVSLGSGDDEAVFASGHYAYATHDSVTAGRIWHDVCTNGAIIFAGSGDVCTSYPDSDFYDALRQVRMGISRERDERFGAHYRALDASRTCFETDPVRVINELRERHIPNVVLDAIDKRIGTMNHDQGRSRFSIARAISFVATKSVSDPDTRLVLEQFAGQYVLAASKY